MPSTARTVGELGLPVLDYADPELRGERFHRVMRELAAQGWLAAAPFGYVVLDREAAAFFLRTRSATFPGRRLAELFGIEDLAFLAPRMRGLELDGEPAFGTVSGIYGLEELPVRFTPTAGSLNPRPAMPM
jgi:hypothetical protein